ncbi:uncharacterized protein LOC144445386 [Glandiceps talaboti]
MKPAKDMKVKKKLGKRKLQKKDSKQPSAVPTLVEKQKVSMTMLADYRVGGIASTLVTNKQAKGVMKSVKSSKLKQLFGQSTEQSLIKTVPASLVNKQPDQKPKVGNVKSGERSDGKALKKANKKQLQKATKDDTTKSSRRKKRKDSKLLLRREEGLRNADTKGQPQKKRKRTDDDETDQIRKKNKKGKAKPKNPEKDKRTVFVGNLPISITKSELKKLFSKYGDIESVRLRSAAPSTLNLPKKVIMIQKDFHPSRNNLNSYVVFKEEESARKALKRNGKEVKGHHIRVDLCANSNKHDHKRSIFIGNIPFKVDDEAVRRYFEQCGDIEAVRLVRDGKTGIGKGFGYVLFVDSSSVEFALKLNGKAFLGRQLRIKRSVKKEKKRSEKPTGKFQKGNPKLSGASLRIQNKMKKKNKKSISTKK